MKPNKTQDRMWNQGQQALDSILLHRVYACCRAIAKRLTDQNLLAKSDETGSVAFWTNSEVADAKQVLAQLWRKK